MTRGVWIALSLVAGVVVYYCEWIELFYAGTCNQGLQFTILRMYALPLAISAALGYFCFRSPIACWLSFMVPSWLLRLIQLIASIEAGSNLSPLLLALDTGQLIVTGLIALGAARLRRNQGGE